VEEVAVIFAHQKVLWVALFILPLLALFLWATWRKRQALIRSFVQNRNLARLTLGTSTLRQKLRRFLLFVAVAFGLFTMARPQWGFTWEEATHRSRDIIVAIDTSKSMLAEDLQPNRLTRAKLAALDLLKLAKYDRFGLVAFSGTAFLQCPLTFDDEAFRQSVQILEPGIIPHGGTALSEAIDSARRAFSEDADQNHRVLILLTDGEDHEAGSLETAARAADEGMKIFTIGVGTSSGELLRVRDDQGRAVYVKDEAGNVVKSRLNEALLQEIAVKSGGFYLPLQGANTIEVLFQKGLAPLPTTERTSKLMKRHKDQFYWPLSLVIILLIIEVFIPEQKGQRKYLLNGKRVANAVAAMLIFAIAPSSSADARKAARYYAEEKYKSALEEYQKLIAENPNGAELHYNAGAAAFNLNQFDLAIEKFTTSARSRDLDLQQQSFYNLGNSEYRLGESTPNAKERIALWEQAVNNYEAALRIRPADEAAKFNRDFVQKRLEELKQEQQQQQQRQSDQQDNKGDENQDEKSQDENQKREENQGDNQDQEQQNDSSQQQDPNQQQNGDQQKQEQQTQQDQQQKQEQKEQSQQQQSSDAPPQQTGDNKQSDQNEPASEGSGEAAQLGRMTPAQARQLLDAQKNEEKALIFIPQERKSSPRNRSLKDW
jgi:Ca-activated chloride channel family protein